MKLKKFNRIKVIDARFEKRARMKNKHHLVPRSRGGGSHYSNLLIMDIERHKALHFLFGTLTLEEIIELLIRVKRIKDSQKEEV